MVVPDDDAGGANTLQGASQTDDRLLHCRLPADQ